MLDGELDENLKPYPTLSTPIQQEQTSSRVSYSDHIKDLEDVGEYDENLKNHDYQLENRAIKEDVSGINSALKMD